MTPDQLQNVPHPFVRHPPHGALWRRALAGHHGPAPQAHAEAVVILGRTGRARYLLGETRVEIGPGTLIWALAGVPHMLLSEAPGFDMWVLLADTRLLPGGEPGLPPLRADASTPMPPRAVTAEGLAELDALAAAAAASREPGPKGAGLRWWLARALALWDERPEGPNTPLHPAVARAVGLLRERPHLSLAAVAAEAGLTLPRLSERFRAEVGVPLADWRLERRLEQTFAARAAGRTWLAAALDGGFGSYASFWRAHHRRYGCAPSHAADER